MRAGEEAATYVREPPSVSIASGRALTSVRAPASMRLPGIRSAASATASIATTTIASSQ
ncbi:hypothetical protein KMB26_33700 [Streptomyces sp. CYG20]|uniref:hypothetical protein n=1 Tax=Streptomyces sp. CYG20 TaxID=2838873 RepID=UPI001BFF2048|nr:hypothetical protein [Streptomyces sp. CYG20]MBT3113960.1 hypothetical protein [Streptomyces sp. CYG20]